MFKKAQPIYGLYSKLLYLMNQDLLYIQHIKTHIWPFNYDYYRIDVLEELDDLDMQHQVQPEREPPMDRIRIDPFNSFSNPNVFKKRHCFSKENTRKFTKNGPTHLQHQL